MKVYRLCNKDEVEGILKNKSFQNVGKICQNSDKNTFNYKEDEKYLHFFRFKESLLYLNTISGRFICEYDIPTEILDVHLGYGNYMDFISFKKLEKVTEYAIPSNLMKYEYLKSVDLIVKDIVDYEDYYEDKSLSGFVKQVYNRELKNNDNQICNENDLTY